METMQKTKWVVDTAHSEILFKVKHMMITNVRGEFRKFEAEIETMGNDFRTASARCIIDTSSIFTNNEDRDAHLKSSDFFNVELHKNSTFEGKNMKETNSEKFKLKGNLTIRGISKEVVFDMEFTGINRDPWGNEKAGFILSGSINRKDWGLVWNATLESGGVLVSDQVNINAEMQFVKAA
jgi:polyisoprenoid-binding protein YceI